MTTPPRIVRVRKTTAEVADEIENHAQKSVEKRQAKAQPKAKQIPDGPGAQALELLRTEMLALSKLPKTQLDDFEVELLNAREIVGAIVTELTEE